MCKAFGGLELESLPVLKQLLRAGSCSLLLKHWKYLTIWTKLWLSAHIADKHVHFGVVKLKKGVQTQYRNQGIFWSSSIGNAPQTHILCCSGRYFKKKILWWVSSHLEIVAVHVFGWWIRHTKMVFNTSNLSSELFNGTKILPCFGKFTSNDVWVFSF